MSGYRTTASATPWWKEPSKDQWYAYIAAWLGWTLDAFDFTVFLVLIVPIAKEFDAPLTWVALVGTLTLWMRLLGAVASGWMADRMGRKAPLMISICGIPSATSSPVSRRRSYFCWYFAPCSESAWVRSGRPARRWRWKPGRRGHAA
jgi:MFS family permease